MEKVNMRKNVTEICPHWTKKDNDCICSYKQQYYLICTNHALFSVLWRNCPRKKGKVTNFTKTKVAKYKNTVSCLFDGRRYAHHIRIHLSDLNFQIDNVW